MSDTPTVTYYAYSGTQYIGQYSGEDSAVLSFIAGKGWTTGPKPLATDRDLWVSIVADATAAQAQAAASASEAAAVAAARFDDIASLAASDALTGGEYYTASSAFNGEPETFLYDANSTATADGALIVDATGMGAGRLVSTRTVYSTVQDMLADMRDGFADGDTLTVDGFRYEVVLSGEDLTTAGGVKLAVLPSANGYDVRAFGAPTDGADATSEVIAAGVAAGARGIVYIPYGVRYQFTAVMDDPSISVEVVFDDHSLINGGYTRDKLFGLAERGDNTAAADTTQFVSSGHHAVFMLDNTGKSGSGSGDTRVVSHLWTAGRQEKGAIPGFPRAVAVTQQLGSGSRWEKVLRKRAPWAAVENDYFRWASGTTVAIGEYCFANNKYYISTTAGTTGATSPSHATGTVSDGGVSWTYVQFSYDASVYSIDDLGRVGINASKGAYFRRERMSVDDTGDMIYSREPVGASKAVVDRVFPTDGSGVAQGGIQVTHTPGRMEHQYDPGTGATSVGAFTGSGIEMKGLIRPPSTLTSNSSTPSVANIGSLILSNTAATNVTDFIDSAANQEIQIIGGNANSTLINGSLRLKGAVNVALPTLGIITLRKASSLTSAWIEVSRSF